MLIDQVEMQALPAGLNKITMEKLSTILISASEEARLLENELDELRALIEELTSSPDPDPEPIPDPDPTPDPSGKPNSLIKDLSLLNEMVCFREYNPQARYVRWSVLLVLKGTNNTIEYNRMIAGGKKVNFVDGEYTLLCDGTPVSTDIPGSDSSISKFTVDVTDIDEGWHIFDIQSPDGTTTESVFYPMFVLKGDKVSIDQGWMPVITGSHHHRMAGLHRLYWVPARNEPTELPFETREYPFFDTVVDGSKLWHDWLVVPRHGQSLQVLENENGILNTNGKYRYKIGYLHEKYPFDPIVEGPRGKASLQMVTEIEPGTAVIPELGGLRHNTYCWTVHGLYKFDDKGNMKCLAGYVHEGNPSYWEEQPPRVRLEGDWDEIPEERRGFRNIWGATKDSFSMRVDDTADKVPLLGAMVSPHPENPKWFCADTMNNRVCRLEFNKDSHDIPPKVTEFITGLAGPFDVKEYWPDHSKRGTLIVAERENHRISEYDMETGEFIRDIVKGAPLAYVDPFRIVHRTADIELLRQEDVVAPDGLYVIDDWLYYGSVAMLQVRRVNLITGEIQIVVPEYPATIRTKWYIKIAVSDGTAGPKHTVFGARWENARFGQPDVFVPYGENPDVEATWDSNEWVLLKSGSSAISRGKQMLIQGLGYNTSVAAKNGRIIWSAVDHGLMQVSLPSDLDPVCDNKKYLRGKSKWEESGYDMIHGENGMGLYGEDLPWGEDEDIDYFLEWFGHKQ